MKKFRKPTRKEIKKKLITQIDNEIFLLLKRIENLRNERNRVVNKKIEFEYSWYEGSIGSNSWFVRLKLNVERNPYYYDVVNSTQIWDKKDVKS